MRVSIVYTRTAIVYTMALILTLYCSSGSTQSYLKYDIPLAVEDKLYDSELQCLQKAVYFESRGLNERSMALVGQTTLNRASSLSGASTICGTVHKLSKSGKCHYSWWCDGKSDVMKDLTQKDRARRIATEVLGGKYKGLTKATHFVHCSVVKANSGWLKNMNYVGRDTDKRGKPAHCFYMNRRK